MNNNDQNLNQLLCQSILEDKRKDRLWRNVRFFIWLLLFGLLLFKVMTPSSAQKQATGKRYFSLVRLSGPIMPGADFSVRRSVPALIHAFADKTSAGVILLINSPGGTPTQASILHDKIIALKKHFHKKVLVVAEDSLTSGAYLVATAADKIYVNDDTITGSIGVIMSSFGLNHAIEKLGISRRVYTAGSNKNRLDPFLPETAADNAKIQSILNTAHKNFINVVKAGRRGKLRGNPKELFSGDFWLGKKATQLGLVDGTLNLWQASQKQFGTTHYIDYTIERGALEKLLLGISTMTHLDLHSEGQYQLLAERN